MDPTIKDFESASAELEAIVKKMEEGDLTLEKALELYERGVQLSRFCHARLEEAESRLFHGCAIRGPQVYLLYEQQKSLWTIWVGFNESVGL